MKIWKSNNRLEVNVASPSLEESVRAPVVEMIPVRLGPEEVVEIVPVRVVEIVPALVVEIVPGFAMTPAEMDIIKTAAQLANFKGFIG
jgi:hypothetical protein